MDEVHTWRNQYAADVVVLLVHPQPADSGCGIASTIWADASTAFAAVRHECATGNYTFAHEIGHLLSARHDRFVDDTFWFYQWGHGYVDPNRQWRTIMAYNNACRPGVCTREQYWSNPDVIFPPTGQPMGTTDWENNASVLNDRKADMALFRNSLTAGIAGPTNIGHNNSCTWTSTVSGGVPPYSYYWSANWSTPSTGFVFSTSPSAPSVTGYGFYYQSYPTSTTITLRLEVADAGGQSRLVERAVSLQGYPSGCYGS